MAQIGQTIDGSCRGNNCYTACCCGAIKWRSVSTAHAVGLSAIYVLQDLAEAAPTTAAELAARRGLPASWRDGGKGATLLTAITDIMAAPAPPPMHRGAILTGAGRLFGNGETAAEIAG
jgi:hypothetical protein